jgi:hypothetical protein
MTEPLSIAARLDGPLHLGVGYIHLDALLAERVWMLSGAPPATTPEEIVRYEIPVDLEPGERFHLASASVGGYERRERRHTVRRFPMEHAQTIGEMDRVSLGSGTHRDYRFPLETGHVVEDALVWYAVGDRNGIARLLGWVTHLGRRRAVGLGRVRSWSVEPCETWRGFPVLARDGSALRNLPIDWPGLGAHERKVARLTYPYHHLGGAFGVVAAPCPR